MREFFRGWKRKVGCVTLALALVYGAMGQVAIEFDAALDRLFQRYGYGHSSGHVENRWGSLTWSTSSEITPVPNDPVMVILLNYRIIVIPLILLTTWLLLSKPRRPTLSNPQQATPS